MVLPAEQSAIAVPPPAAPAPAAVTAPEPAPDAEPALQIETRTGARWSNASGPGKSSSFYNNGAYTTFEPAFLLRKDYRSGWTVSGEFRPRATGDDLNDLKGLSVEALSVEVRNSSHSVTFGDYFASMSQYSFSQMVKGGGYQRNFADGENYFRAALGSFDSQWESLYSDDASETMNRLGGGLRRQFSGENYRFGLNWAFVDDDETDDARARSQEDAYYQNVGALDWEYRFGQFTLDGEHAGAFTNKKTAAGATDNKGGHANRARLQGSVAGARLTASVENVSPEYLPLAGSASQDRRKYLFQVNRRLSPVWQAFGKFTLNHDALGGSDAMTRTTNTTYDAGVTRTRFLGRRQGELGLSWRRTMTNTHSGARERAVDRLQLTLSDQVTRATRARFLFEPTLDKDLARGKEAANFLYELRFSDRRRLPKSWTLNSTLSGRRRETENIVTMGYDLQNGLSARSEFSRPGGIQTGFEYDYTELNAHSGADSRTARGRAFVGYRPDADFAVELDLGQTRYGFTDGAREYTERLVKLNLNKRL